MIAVVLAILVLIGGTIAAVKLRKGFVAAITAVVVLALLLVGSVRTVPAGHTGVVTTFGRVEDYTLDSGAHLVAPWKRVIRMDNRVQKHTIELPCFSSDIQEVNVSYTVNYQISKADAMTLFSTVGISYYDVVIAPNVAESVKVATARYTAEALVAMRDSLAQEIEGILSAKLSHYNIELVGTSIENMDFTDVFTNAVEAKQVAQQNKLRAQTEAEQRVIESEAAAEIKKINADAAAYEVLAKAEAEAEANRMISASLTENLIDYTYASSWNGQLPRIVTGEGGGLLINAGDLLGTGGREPLEPAQAGE